MSNTMFEAQGLSDDDLIVRMTKMRRMLGSQSCLNHPNLGDSIGINLAILEEEYECRQRRKQAEAAIRKPRKGEKPVEEKSPHITLGDIPLSDDPYGNL